MVSFFLISEEAERFLFFDKVNWQFYNRVNDDEKDMVCCFQIQKVSRAM